MYLSESEYIELWILQMTSERIVSRGDLKKEAFFYFLINFVYPM